ncbi:7-carboxy-7-deazaguanine synthase QueE [Porphyromonas circumdentaria]|uniref:7-carboxy-7-deazaguanine synthase n=2 Tax=Porphyromonas circumdentaria TaxID=29524 RepID=A0A1T4Q273_9PORP|nr:7-carboxy-7-deazaguanine synthase QueE [Porphyromonas circumdentaria]MDO4723113.1 7-carboxy-7-deazaguanine synthase QueE [Porphyromonas circumdentaria]SJZ97872.1 Organic radical activating enzyme [Porphyromonas circumdentaria]
MKLLINEIFYSLQGEGAQMGFPMIFIRFSMCNLRCSYCDTDFKEYTEMTLEELYQAISSYPARNILWTGGEPTLSLTEEIVEYFHQKGYRQSIETNGTHPVPQNLDYITCSPKPEAFHLLRKNFPNGVSEWRFPFGPETPLPPNIEELPKALNYFLSPIFSPEEGTITPYPIALNACIDYIKEHPEWRLSIQLHKLIGIQ